MIRFLLRTLGFVVLAAAFAALVVDGTRSIAAGHLLQYSLEDTAAWMGVPRSTAAGEVLVRAPEVIRVIAAALLALPGWMVAAALGLSLLYLGRPPAAEIGFSGRRA